MKQSLGPKILAQPTPAWVIGSYDQTGAPNVMTAAWCGVCCSKPPCLTVSIQTPRHSFAAIMERKAFTVNIASAHQAAEVDYFGMVSGKNVDKFQTTGMTPVRGEMVDAPYIEEFPLIVECKVVAVHDLGVHTQFVGQIMDVKADPSVLDDKGMPDMSKISPFVFTPGNRAYYGIGAYLGQGFDLGKAFMNT
ncbi:flavin reductase family protein [Desulfoplanes formicivorans]|uniref:Flavoredoxin n=1 Tax=Desulfoplanes formicivorans TaxID=1592317 RepID=A0A194AHT4_9BACT|nr:flavin reductase family protein [Desulfoplanes formicivorans]GAU08334.1 flavoredoxin [Desulfoplanes formicivorans]